MKQKERDCNSCEHLKHCKEDGRIYDEIAWNSEHHDFLPLRMVGMGRTCPLKHFEEKDFLFAAEAEKLFFELCDQGLDLEDMGIENFKILCVKRMTERLDKDR